MTATKTVTAFGETLTVRMQKDAWVTSNGAEFGTAREAMRAEMEALIEASGDDPEDFEADIEAVLDRMGGRLAPRLETTADIESLRAALTEDPTDCAARLVYADALEETGKPLDALWAERHRRVAACGPLGGPTPAEVVAWAMGPDGNGGQSYSTIHLTDDRFRVDDIAGGWRILVQWDVCLLCWLVAYDVVEAEGTRWEEGGNLIWAERLCWEGKITGE